MTTIVHKSANAENKAVIDLTSGLIENVILADDSFTLPGKLLLTCPDGVTIGWRYDPNTGEFSPPPAPPPEPLYRTAESAKLALYVMIDEFTASITGPVPNDEKASWTAKSAAAQAYDAGNANEWETFILETEARITGESVHDLTVRILRNAAFYVGISASVAGIRRVAERDFSGATDPFDYETVIDSVNRQLEALRPDPS